MNLCVTEQFVSALLNTSPNRINIFCRKNNLQNKVSRLFKKENGCVKEEAKGSFVIGRDLNIWFGWNYYDNMKCKGIMETRDTVNELLNQGYVFYHYEDLVVYLNLDPSNRYAKCRKRRGELYDVRNDKDELRELLGWTEQKWSCEKLRAQL